MQLLAELEAEHRLIEAVLGSLRAYVERRLRDEAGAAPAEAYLRFFRLFAGDFHHGREEELLLPALIRLAELPGDRGPIPALVSQHREMEAMLAEVARLLPQERLSDAQRSLLASASVRYSHALWRHIDAEDTVLLPESEARLRRFGAAALPVRPMRPVEQAAAEEGRRLLETYPPLADRDVVRGEGCVFCPSHGISCAGVEREWWSDEEWDDFFDRVG